MTKTCERCGTEMQELGFTFKGPDGLVHQNLECPLDPKDCRIAVLERQLAEATSIATDLNNMHLSEIDALESKLRAREADCLALREALEAARSRMPLRDSLPITPTEARRVLDLADEALSNTSATAQEIVQRVEREVEDRMFKAMLAAAASDGVVLDQAEEDQLRAAILGSQIEKEG